MTEEVGWLLKKPDKYVPAKNTFQKVPTNVLPVELHNGAWSKYIEMP